MFISFQPIAPCAPIWRVQK